MWHHISKQQLWINLCQLWWLTLKTWRWEKGDWWQWLWLVRYLPACTVVIPIMELKDFGQKLLRRITWCIYITKFSVLVNDTLPLPLAFFKVLETKGPLSSYLFVLAMEALSCFVKRAKERGYLLGGLRSGVEAVRKWKCSICFLLMISLYFVRFLKLRLPTYVSCSCGLRPFHDWK